MLYWMIVLEILAIIAGAAVLMGWIGLTIYNLEQGNRVLGIILLALLAGGFIFGLPLLILAFP